MDNILVIGNGFDKAHGLKTTYSDFIEFYKFISNNEELIKNDDSNLKEELENVMHAKYSDIQVNYFRETFKDEATFNEMIDNSWFKLVQKCIDDKNAEWSNLEHFIGVSMKCLCKMENNIGIQVIKFDDYTYNYKIYDALDEDFQNISNNNSELEDFELIRILSKKYIDDFKNFSKYLGLYLKHFLNDSDYRINGFIGLNSNYKHVLSFNYTYTFSNIYGMGKDIHFIHGSTKDVTKLVFGTDSDIVCTIEDRKCAYESFKKYFQRIIYGTGNKYRNWINDQSGHILFYGFSFAIEDEKAIKELINSGKKIFIYYINDDALINIVKNLSIILTEEKLIELTGKNRIIFINSLDDNEYTTEIRKYIEYKRKLENQRIEDKKIEGFWKYGQ